MTAPPGIPGPFWKYSVNRMGNKCILPSFLRVNVFPRACYRAVCLWRYS